MIISKTPLRISFVGGGSDIAAFYENHQGAVVSTAINQFVYITVRNAFDRNTWVSYSSVESVNDINQLKHDLARESLKFLNIDKPLQIASSGNIPAGTGLGSSSAYTVGLLLALHKYQKKTITKKQLAHYASIVEIEKVGKPIGKQDHYVAAFGGLNYITFSPGGAVNVESIHMKQDAIKTLQDNLLLLYTGIRRKSKDILRFEKKVLEEEGKKRKIMIKMVDLAREMKDSLDKNNIDSFGELLHENWKLKRSISSVISSPQIDRWYVTARKNGAIGGKLCGAGGGGFMLFYAQKKHHKRIIASLSKLKPVPFVFEEKGSTIIFNNSKGV